MNSREPVGLGVIVQYPLSITASDPKLAPSKNNLRLSFITHLRVWSNWMRSPHVPYDVPPHKRGLAA